MSGPVLVCPTRSWDAKIIPPTAAQKPEITKATRMRFCESMPDISAARRLAPTA
jgi:hypothetical protein